MPKKLFIPVFLLVMALLACAGLPPATVSTPTPGDKIEAKTAIQTYAREVLGLELPRLFAGGTTGELSLPVSLQNGVEIALDLAGNTYFGVWNGGIASLSFGDSDVSGDFIADVRDGALGVFAVNVSAAPPEDAAAALDLIRETYPGLRDYQWIETPTEQGYAFTGGEAQQIAVQSWSVELTGTTIHAGVLPGVLNEQSFVWVVVASGILAAPFENQP